MPSQTEKKDWAPLAALGIGAVGIGMGVYFFMKKPKGVDPGDIVIALVTFDYSGKGGNYIVDVSLGKLYSVGPIQIFDHIEGLTWDLPLELPAPEEEFQSFEFEVECKLPEAIAPKTYDGEVLLRTPDMEQFTYLPDARAWAKAAIKVRKEV